MKQCPGNAEHQLGIVALLHAERVFGAPGLPLFRHSVFPFSVIPLFRHSVILFVDRAHGLWYI